MEIGVIKSLSIEDIEDYTKELVDKYNQNSKEQIIGREFLKYYPGFIGFNTKISYGSLFGLNYSLYDYQVYIDYLIEIKKQLDCYDSISFIDLINITYYYMKKYFRPSEEIDIKEKFNLRDEVIFKYLNKISKNEDEWINNKNSLNITVFKGQGIAMCSEKSSLAENLLSLLGIEIYYCSGIFSNTDINNYDGHAFNFIKIDNNNYVVDFSLPVFIYDENKKIASQPFVSKISKDLVSELLDNREVINISDYHYEYLDGELKIINDINNRFYGIGKIDNKNYQKIK